MRNVRSSAVSLVAVALVTGVTLSGCSFSLGSGKSKSRPAAEDVANDDEAPLEVVPKAQARTLAVGKSVWYAGLKVTVDEVTHDPQAEEQLTAKVLVENLSEKDWRPSLPILFSADQQQFRGSFVESTLVGGKQKGRLVLEFRLGDWAGDVTTGEFILGEASEVQSRLPVGGGTLVANEPRSVLPATKVQHRDVALSFKSCEVRADVVPRHNQAQNGKTMVACWLDMQDIEGKRSHVMSDDAWRLKLPDGTVVGPTHAPIVHLYDRKLAADVYLAFQTTWPAPGTYAIQFVHLYGGEKETPERVKELALTL